MHTYLALPGNLAQRRFGPDVMVDMLDDLAKQGGQLLSIYQGPILSGSSSHEKQDISFPKHILCISPILYITVGKLDLV